VSGYTRSDAGRTQCRLFRSAPGAARGKDAVHRDGGKRAHAKFLGPGNAMGLVHIKDGHLAVRASHPVNQFDRFLTEGTTGAEDFDFTFVSHRFDLRC
jgi:hypothetical protein